MNLTNEQREAVERGEAVECKLDSTPCVLLRSDVFERVRQMIYDDSEWTHEEMRQALARSSAANGWDDPIMDEYDRYDEVRASRCP